MPQSFTSAFALVLSTGIGCGVVISLGAANDELMRSLCGVDIENEITAGIVDGIVQLDREFQSDAHMFFRLTAAVRCE